ncbi:hypothetical protein BJ878DRAFT_556319 [Calycina marina]|uniref:Uncharacterized protein n=1 Tax=Calycina marina TaxID=1763456 RepID=A0A9P8CD06_9HELO|nr:hypothetical protein BJ878DRAFT_556319 [Calycina marina]
MTSMLSHTNHQSHLLLYFNSITRNLFTSHQQHAFLNPVVLALVTYGLAANTAAYTALSKAASKNLVVGKQYAFKSVSVIGHQRLIVGRVTGKAGSLDISTNVYELFKVPDPGDPKKMLVDLRDYKDSAYKQWDCTRGKYSYKGEVLTSLSPDDIQQKGVDLMVGKETYSRLTNNCQHYVDNLYAEIRARAFLTEYLKLRRGIASSKAEFERQ